MLLVREASGPALIEAGKTAVYRATAFNMPEPPSEELQQINWRITSDGETDLDFKRRGETLEVEFPESFIGKSVVVMPYRNSPTPVVSAITRVISDADITTSDSRVSVLTREQWGARTDLRRRGSIVDPSRRTEVFIHHTVIVDSDMTINEWENLDEVKRRMRQLQTIREEDLGADVPYSMVAFCMSNGDLVLGEGRGWHRSGAHTRGHNTSGLGISFQGNFERLPLPAHFDAQLAAVGNTLRELRVEHGFVNLGTSRPHGREVFGHRDVGATACPGQHLFDRLNLIRFL